MASFCCSLYCFFVFFYFILMSSYSSTENFPMASHRSIIRSQLYNLAQKAILHLVPVHIIGLMSFHTLLCSTFSPQSLCTSSAWNSTPSSPLCWILLHLQVSTLLSPQSGFPWTLSKLVPNHSVSYHSIFTLYINLSMQEMSHVCIPAEAL